MRGNRHDLPILPDRDTDEAFGVATVEELVT